LGEGRGGGRVFRSTPLRPRESPDFLCEARADRIIEDAQRMMRFEARGYRVMRFWNNDVMGNIGGVWDALTASLR
jgi:very-short-patch-repair endonuclease